MSLKSSLGFPSSDWCIISYLFNAGEMWLNFAGPLIQPPLHASNSRNIESLSRRVSKDFNTSFTVDNSEKAMLCICFFASCSPFSIPPSMG